MENSAPPAPLLPRYTVDDQRRDTRPPLDTWAEYLRMRYARREGFYKALEPSAQELIRKEVRRIRYFRDHFKEYRIASDDGLPLVALLDDSRRTWRDIAVKRAAQELARVQRELDRNGDTRGRPLNRSRDILRMVEHWHSKDYAKLQDARAPESYMADFEAGTVPPGEDNPREPNYGYNGWIIVWDEDKGGVDMNHHLVHGHFPHQKISIQQLLYNKEGTPLKRTTKKNQFRYFHLPANSMKWVEDAMSRYYSEDSIEFDSKRVLNIKSNAQRLLRNELWRGQQRGGNNLPAHSRQIGSRCSMTPSAPTSSGHVIGSPGPRKDFALFMPFLHWEVEKRLHRMAQFVQVAKSRKDHRDRLRRASTSRYKGKFVDLAKIQASKQPARPVTGFEADGKRTYSWRPKHPLAKYIWLAAKLFQIIDEAADGRLIEDHLFSEPPLHMRRTLEQFYYWTADDTAHRDRDQVVCRATRAMTDDQEAAARIVMVDQLWLWILDDNTVISSFPRRWGRNKPDPSAVHRGIRDRLGALDSDEIHSVYDLAFIVIDECSKVFFDRAKPLDHRPEVVDLFSSAISNIADKKTIAYEGFGHAVSRISLDTLDTVEQLLRRSLNIGFEWSILVEAQQVIDELQIMQEIFAQQSAVMKEFERNLKSLHWSAKAKNGTVNEEVGSERMNQERALERVASLVSDMEQRRDELASMERLQTKTRSQLRELLDMKQQQSNIIEAKAAIQRADESVLQGRSIVVFTVVTIFFLPLSFISSIFGMNAKEFSNDGVMSLARQLTYMFAISSAVIFISLALAFSTWTRTALHVSFTYIYATIEDWLGWRNRKYSYNSTALKKKQLAHFKQLESRATARRLTEISGRARDVSPRNAGTELQKASTWAGRLTNGGLGRFRRAGPVRGGADESV